MSILHAKATGVNEVETDEGRTNDYTTAVPARSHSSKVNRMLDVSRAEIPQRAWAKHSEPHKLGQQIVIADRKR